jgi:tRNA pseudouridine55 synthase
MDSGSPGRGRSPDRPKVAWRPVHGVLLIDKPSGITSTAALARARRVFRAEKGGHTGTLDPLASGLLPLCFGEATKFASDLLDADKSYRATLQLGVATDSGDSDGHVVATRPVDVDRAAIDRAVARFRGPIAQIPPMHSALKRDGQPLYKLARQGITVERAARNVTIHRLDIVDFTGDTLTIEVDCTKGTYIRSLAVDIGDLLGCGAHLTALRRTAVADLVVGAAVSLATLETMASDKIERHLLPIDRLIDGLPRIDLDDDLARRFSDGQRLAWSTSPTANSTARVRVYAAGPDRTVLLGTAMLGGDGVLAPVRLVARATKALAATS